MHMLGEIELRVSEILRKEL